LSSRQVTEFSAFSRDFFPNMPFFETVRLALVRHPVGVHSLAAPANEQEFAAFVARVGGSVPPLVREFWATWNGGTLFHEAVCLHPVQDIERADSGWLCFGESSDGVLWLSGEGRVVLVQDETHDPLVAGSDFGVWLDITTAREALLLDEEGEFRDVFDDDDGTLKPSIQRKRTMLGRKRDPHASLYLFELAEIELEHGRSELAIAHLQNAVSQDEHAGPAWALLASLESQAGRAKEAAFAMKQAAAATLDPSLRAQRLLEAALFTADAAEQEMLLDSAVSVHPELGANLVSVLRRQLAEGQMADAKQVLARLRCLGARIQNGAGEELAVLERECRTRDALRVLS